MFSRGLQGVVVGLFTDIPKDEMEPILTTLIQFGETLSDVYADLRWKHFVDALEHELDEKALAREVINAVSPVGRLIVSHKGRSPSSDDRSASLAKLRQYYVISKVAQHWQEGSVKITNNELKRFFEGLDRDAKNGYQVTSFASEFEKILTDRVTATKTRNALSLSWDKGS